MESGSGLSPSKRVGQLSLQQREKSKENRQTYSTASTSAGVAGPGASAACLAVAWRHVFAVACGELGVLFVWLKLEILILRWCFCGWDEDEEGKKKGRRD